VKKRLEKRGKIRTKTLRLNAAYKVPTPQIPQVELSYGRKKRDASLDPTSLPSPPPTFTDQK